MLVATENLDRLPKWAKSEIERLRRDNAHMIAERSIGPENSDTFLWVGGLNAAEDKPLGQRAKIDFRPLGAERTTVQFSVYMDGNVLDINATDGISVMPLSSNHVRIQFDRPQR
jgi:hypothetical protein